MKIKNILYAMLGAVCLSVASCDTVGENDRLIYVKPAEVKRCVLLEDFTGQRCINCPNAADVIAQLQEQYGEDNVIAVGIHGGPLAVNSNGKVTGLRTATGDEYYAAAGSPSLPAGRVGVSVAHTQVTNGRRLYMNRYSRLRLLLSKPPARMKRHRVNSRLMSVHSVRRRLTECCRYGLWRTVSLPCSLCLTALQMPTIFITTFFAWL